jgi:hypothetical protein
MPLDIKAPIQGHGVWLVVRGGEICTHLRTLKVAGAGATTPARRTEVRQF